MFFVASFICFLVVLGQFCGKTRIYSRFKNHHSSIININIILGFNSCVFLRIVFPNHHFSLLISRSILSLDAAIRERRSGCSLRD